jgi:hypothetical protein
MCKGTSCRLSLDRWLVGKDSLSIAVLTLPLLLQVSMDDVYAALVTNFINTDLLGVEAWRGIALLHLLGCPPTHHFLILVVLHIPHTPDDDVHFWFADHSMLGKEQPPDHPLDCNTVNFVEAEFAYQPPGYYTLLVINLEQSRSIVTWLPQPVSGL